MKKIDKVSFGLEKILDVISIILILGMVIFLMIQIVGRFGFNHGFPWTEESAKICLIMLAFVGAAVTSVSGRHVSITILDDALKGRAKKVVYVIQQSISVVFVVLVFIYSIPSIQIASKSITTNTHINYAIIYSIIPISCVIMIFAHVFKIVRKIKDIDAGNRIEEKIPEKEEEK